MCFFLAVFAFLVEAPPNLAEIGDSKLFSLTGPIPIENLLFLRKESSFMKEVVDGNELTREFELLGDLLFFFIFLKPVFQGILT